MKTITDFLLDHLLISATLALLAFSGCFGAPAMHYDIQEYNKATVASEKEMLLYNVGALHFKQPPHFMMLSSVSQSRMFSASGSFQWSQMLNALTPTTMVASTVNTLSGANPTPASSRMTTTANPTLAQGGNYQAGPFAAGAVENPTIQFVPIQGGDFAQRFESPITDKFLYFFEDQRWYARKAEYKNLIMLFAQSLYLQHGETAKGAPCSPGLLRNDGFGTFSDCVTELLDSGLNLVQIDGSHPVPTVKSVAPMAADVVTALTSGYEWKERADKYPLTTPIRVPAWLDFEPKFAPPTEPEEPNSPTPVFWIERKPRWRGLQYWLPKDYAWEVDKINKADPNSAEIYALLPDGYELERDGAGRLTVDRRGRYVLLKSEEPRPHLAYGKRTKDSSKISVAEKFVATDVGRGLAGIGIPAGTTIVSVDNVTRTARMSNPSIEDNAAALSVGDVNEFSYADEVVRDVWPVPQDYFYIELRRGEVGGTTAERVCHFQNDASAPVNDVICGYFKIGNLLEIMQRLADMACIYQDEQSITTYCSESVFGIGSSVPAWAENSAPYQRGTGPYVWVPAHNPRLHPDLAERDRTAFFDLYKLYQMSLVDTSKLVPGTPAITIGK
jgi:hypothetical protein